MSVLLKLSLMMCSGVYADIKCELFFMLIYRFIHFFRKSTRIGLHDLILMYKNLIAIQMYHLNCCSTCVQPLSEDPVDSVSLEPTFQNAQSVLIGQLAPVCCD